MQYYQRYLFWKPGDYLSLVMEFLAGVFGFRRRMGRFHTANNSAFLGHRAWIELPRAGPKFIFDAWDASLVHVYLNDRYYSLIEACYLFCSFYAELSLEWEEREALRNSSWLVGWKQSKAKQNPRRDLKYEDNE